MNTRSMRAPRKVDTAWPQTEVLPRIRTRVIKREPVRLRALDYAILFALAITVAALAYACTGPK